MRLLTLTMIAAGAMLSASAPAFAQAPPATTCAATDAGLPAEFASWAARADAAAAVSRKGLAKAELTVGKAVTAALPSTRDVAYVTQPDKPGGTVSHGGLFAFKVTEAGTYRVALGSAAWIDVLKDGKAIESTAHGHGPDCSTIRKVVDFPLTPGRYVLQISANADASLPVLVTRRP